MNLAPGQRPLMISAGLVVAVMTGSWFSDLMLALMAGMLVMAWQVLRLLYYAVRGNTPGLGLTGIRLLLWLAGSLGTVVLFGHYDDQARAQGDTVIAALQAYRAREGRYPEKLDALAPKDIATVPMVAMSPLRDRPFRYISADNGATFMLMYVIGFRMGAEYHSGTAKWMALD